MLPVSYLEISSEPFRVIEYGSAVGKYDFRKKTNSQLSFRRDDELVLIRRIDQNWFEARLGNSSKGAVPRNYLTAICEPITNEDHKIDAELMSPASSIGGSRPVSAVISHSPVQTPVSGRTSVASSTTKADWKCMLGNFSPISQIATQVHILVKRVLD